MEMSTKYSPQDTESKWYKYWINEKLFQAEGEGNKQPYAIVIPPPNVTGKLHIGHAWDGTIQDLLSRFKRMQGYDVLYLPGMDHAGIATQTKVEAKLREEGLTRHDLGREKFLERTWDWKEEYAQFIRNQWAKLGLSLDYSRERFTLDDNLSHAVRKVFVDLYQQGLIYRGEYIINWDPVTKTALSDIEVEYKDVEGAMYHMAYPLADGSGSIEIATTRPETMLGDTGIAVHPDDERYQDVIGKKAVLPLVGRELQIVADDYVDMSFGSGAVKITPAHDPNDFDIGVRHDLEQVIVMHEDGTMNERAGSYDGMNRFDCREAVVNDLKTNGVLLDIEEHTHAVGHSERSGAVVEPYLSTQWFVNMKPLADRSIKQQQSDDKVNFVPAKFEHTYLQWMENIRDWCVSRQLWWGHRIPAWYHKQTGELYVGMEAPEYPEHWEQDEDVLDTWFSSALWPFSTMGWPEDTKDLQRYYPTDVLATGYDIIFFWVARMIFQGLTFTDRPPFQDTLIHGLVRDSEGRKMSKSLGNGVDPMDVIDRYGADSLRFFLATGTSPGNDLRFFWEKVEAAWNFGNKIWNASRFAMMHLEDMTYENIDLSGEKSLADRWILARLNETVEVVTRSYEAYEFGDGGQRLYAFIWDDFCDWYIEMAKIPLYGDNETAKQTTRSVLAYVLDNILRLLHPMMPFITEEIWQHLPNKGLSITRAAWPQTHAAFAAPDVIREVEVLIDVIRSVRHIRAEVEVAPSKEVDIHMKPHHEDMKQVLQAHCGYLEAFCHPRELVIDTQLKVPEKSISAHLTGVEIYMPLAGMIDIDMEISRLEKEKEKLNQEVDRVQKKLSNEHFVNKAPADIVNKEKAKEQEYLDKREKVTDRIQELQT